MHWLRRQLTCYNLSLDLRKYCNVRILLRTHCNGLSDLNFNVLLWILSRLMNPNYWVYHLSSYSQGSFHFLMKMIFLIFYRTLFRIPSLWLLKYLVLIQQNHWTIHSKRSHSCQSWWICLKHTQRSWWSVVLTVKRSTS